MQILLIIQLVAFLLRHYCPNFSIFLLLEEDYVNAVTLSESTLMFGDNLIKVNIDLFKHIPYIKFRENGKDTNGTIIFYIKSGLIFMIGCNRKTPFFNFEGKFELNNELLKL